MANVTDIRPKPRGKTLKPAAFLLIITLVIAGLDYIGIDIYAIEILQYSIDSASSEPIAKEPDYETHFTGNSLEGKVVKIADGDTLTMLVNNAEYRIRLAEIDTPEKGQPFGTRAKQALSKLVFGKTIRAEVQTVDRYGRSVARIYVDNIDVNEELIRQGMAWVFRQYATDSSLLELEEEARSAQRGIWSSPETKQVPPWEWRRGERGLSLTPVESDSENIMDKDACGKKRYCRQMTSCEEVMFYFKNCGLKRLDGDKDGIPCEKICR